MKKRAIFTILLITLCALCLCSCKNEPEKKPDDGGSNETAWEKLFSFSNVTLKIDDDTNIWLVKYVDSTHIYKIENATVTNITDTASENLKNFFASLKTMESSFSLLPKKSETNPNVYEANGITITNYDGASKKVGNITISLNDDGKIYLIQTPDIRIDFENYGSTRAIPAVGTPTEWINLFINFENVSIKSELYSSPSILSSTSYHRIVKDTSIKLYYSSDELFTSPRTIDPESKGALISLIDFSCFYNEFNNSDKKTEGNKTTYKYKFNNDFEVEEMVVENGIITSMTVVETPNANEFIHVFTFSNYGTTVDPTVTV